MELGQDTEERGMVNPLLSGPILILAGLWRTTSICRWGTQAASIDSGPVAGSFGRSQHLALHWVVSGHTCMTLRFVA